MRCLHVLPRLVLQSTPRAIRSAGENCTWGCLKNVRGVWHRCVLSIFQVWALGACQTGWSEKWKESPLWRLCREDLCAGEKTSALFQNECSFFSYYNVIIVVMVVTFNNWFYICININHLAELVSLVQYFRTLKSLLTPCRFQSVNRLIFTHIGASWRNCTVKSVLELKKTWKDVEDRWFMQGAVRTDSK